MESWQRAFGLYHRTVTDNDWIKKELTVLPDGREWFGPHPKQQQFLLHAETRELFYGGAGGGGKSQALWYGALQFVHVPGFAALILRRTYADLAKPGALMDRAKEYLADTGASWNDRDKQWTFPSGAKIAFGYLQHEDDKLQYKSAEFQYIAFDELTDFTETQYSFLFTRLRKKRLGPLAEVPLRMRSASNPGGPGHAWVKARFVDPKTREPKRVFIPAKMEDNPSLDAEGYEESLSNTDAITRAQIKAGDWDAVVGGRFKPEWFPRYTTRGDYLILRKPDEVDERSLRVWDFDRFITCDPAASAKTTADWTVAGVWLRTPRNELLLLDAARFQKELPDIVPQLQALADKWRVGGVWIEAVAANNGVFTLAARTRMPARKLDPLGQDKLVRATPAINLAATGRVWLPNPGVRPGMPLDDIESEWYRFTGNEKVDANDDAVDMLSYAAIVALDYPSQQQRQTAPRVIGGG